uniref:Uncharacterized protein n=1 Tax=Arundo donax TaxID=35708 RepID=A0A0A9HLF3_ARUDO
MNSFPHPLRILFRPPTRCYSTLDSFDFPKQNVEAGLNSFYYYLK